MDAETKALLQESINGAFRMAVAQVFQTYLTNSLTMSVMQAEAKAKVGLDSCILARVSMLNMIEEASRD